MNQAPTSGAISDAVYVQTNTAPNEVIAFRRGDDGSLDRIGSAATGGDGGGSPHLPSQGSVALTRDGRHVLVTNAASDDVSVFSVAGDGSLVLRDRVHTGSTPRSVAERDGLVVVLNTGEPSLASFRLSADGIAAVTEQALPSDADPAQVAFSPDGSLVVVTARGTDSIVTYEVAGDGTFGASDAIASQGPTPYGFGFTSGGTLVVTDAFAPRRARRPHPPTRSLTARSCRVPARSATAAARSAGRSSHLMTGSPLRRTSPTGPCRVSRSRPTVRSRWRMRRLAYRSTV
jgi:6-phosphogluconolactonase